MKEVGDELLMISVKGGILDALTPLFDRYHCKLYSFFLRLTFDRELSKDLTQNVFYRILKYRQGYREEYKFRSWMYQIARNVMADHYEKEKNQIKDNVSIDRLSGAWPEVEMGQNEIETERDKSEMKRTLYRALSKLPADQREIIILSRFQGLKYDEIAEITGSSVGAIKVKAHRIIIKLREIYSQEVEQ